MRQRETITVTVTYIRDFRSCSIKVRLLLAVHQLQEANVRHCCLFTDFARQHLGYQTKDVNSTSPQ